MFRVYTVCVQKWGVPAVSSIMLEMAESSPQSTTEAASCERDKEGGRGDAGVTRHFELCITLEK